MAFNIRMGLLEMEALRNEQSGSLSHVEVTGQPVAVTVAEDGQRCFLCLNAFAGMWVTAVNGRIVDLLNPFKSFNSCHPDRYGSASMKAMLPALTGRNHAELPHREISAALNG